MATDASTTETPTKKKRTRKKKPVLIEEPVVIKVTRTVKRKLSPEDQQQIDTTTDQETPGQPRDESTDVDLDTIEVRRFLVEPAKVNYHYTLGRNVHYQSVSVGCSVTIPCYKEEIEDALEEAKELVAARLKIENRKTGAVLDHLIEQRIKKDQELANKGVR